MPFPCVVNIFFFSLGLNLTQLLVFIYYFILTQGLLADCRLLTSSPGFAYLHAGLLPLSVCVCVYKHTHTHTFIRCCCRPVLSRFSVIFLIFRANSVLVLKFYVTMNASHTALLHLR
jgi:hypothetical protein